MTICEEVEEMSALEVIQAIDSLRWHPITSPKPDLLGHVTIGELRERLIGKMLLNLEDTNENSF